MKLNNIISDTYKQLGCLGSYQIYGFILGIFLFLGLYVDFFILLAGFMVIHLIAVPIRIFFFRQRPIKEKYTNFIEKILASGFPSLHSARLMFLLLFFISFFETLLLTFYLSTIAFISIYSRIERKRHFISDVVFGVLHGVMVWVFIYSLL